MKETVSNMYIPVNPKYCHTMGSSIKLIIKTANAIIKELFTTIKTQMSVLSLMYPVNMDKGT